MTAGNEYTERLSALQSKLHTEGAGLALLAGTDQMRYLTGWKEGGHERFVGLFVPATGSPALVVPAMNAPQAMQTEAGIQTVLGWHDETGWHGQARELFETYASCDLSHVQVDDELLSVHLLGLQGLFPQTRFSAIGTTMSRLREIKAPEELAKMKRAADLIDSIIEDAFLEMREGITELELQGWFYEAFKKHGTAASFTPTCCFGPNGALPHHHTGDTRLKAGDVCVIDVGCLYAHYASDITRTVAFQSIADPHANDIYALVYAAHMAARKAATPGTSGEAVDAASRKVITDAGYGEFFMHRTGHGIGISTHEPPYIVAGNDEPLLPGMCFSVEPGVYLQGKFGVRIENIVTMTEDGAVSLNAEPTSHLRIVGN